MWMDLDKIFRNSDVSTKLKENYRTFVLVDIQYRDKLKSTIERPNAFKACTTQNGLADFKEWIRALEKLQKSIELHLDEQRVLFPRYYFLSNEELLMITSTSQDPKNVQKFFGNMFQNILELEFDPERPDSILAIVSHEKEPLSVPSSTKTKGSVEEWLRVLENAMLNSLKRFTIEANRETKNLSKKDFVLSYPTQVVCTVEMMEFANSIEGLLAQAVSSDKMQEQYDSIYYMIDDLTLFIRENHPYYIERRLSTLIGQHIHNRDNTEMLKDEGVSSVQDYRWQRVKSSII